MAKPFEHTYLCIGGPLDGAHKHCDGDRFAAYETIPLPPIMEAAPPVSSRPAPAIYRQQRFSTPAKDFIYWAPEGTEPEEHVASLFAWYKPA